MRRLLRTVTSATAIAAIVAAAGMAAAPATSAAAAKPAPRALRLTGPGGAVVVRTDPFRLSVLDRSGRTVLAEVPDSRPGPTPYASVRPPASGAHDGTPPLYAPLTVTVGAASDATYPGTPWQGNLLTSSVTGVQYAARRVTAVHRSAGALSLTVATGAPGLTLRVRIRRAGPMFDVTATPSGAALAPGQALIGDSFSSNRSEAFHGFGGQHAGVDLRGRTIDNWLQEEDFGAGPATGVSSGVPGTGGASYLFPDGPTAGYYVQPQFISSHGYGFALRQPQLAVWRLDTDKSDAWNVQVAAPSLHYAVAPGGPAQAVRALTAVTGRQPVPPRWALGPQLDRLIYTGNSSSGYYAEVEADIAQLARDQLPLTGYRIEGWAALTQKQLHHVIEQLHRLHIHPLLYFRSYTAADGAATEPASDFTTAVQHGYLARTATGAPYLVGSPFIAGVAGVIDFTNPAAVRWFSRRLDAGLAAGADGFMSDFGEQVQPDMHFADGSTGATMHNRYPVLYQRVVRRAVTAWERRHPHRAKVFWYSRAGYSGSARYESATFPGDETTDWSIASGLASSTPDMLNRAVGGDYGYTTDIGGYEDATTGATTKPLFLRWAEWAALSPLFRDHGSAESGTHTPWMYGAATLRAYRRLSRLHQSAEPLIRRLWRAADRTGIPPTRPLWLAYPHDRRAAVQDQEWLLGPNLLVAPVVTEGATGRRVYLPAGCWRYSPTGRRFTGRRFVRVHAGLTTLPRFARCGTSPLARR